MQVTNSLGKGTFPPPGGGAPPSDIASQIKQQRTYYQRIHFKRSLSFWWSRILLIVLAVIIAVTLRFSFAGSAFGVIGGSVFFRRIFAAREFYISGGKMRTLYAILTILQAV